MGDIFFLSAAKTGKGALDSDALLTAQRAYREAWDALRMTVKIPATQEEKTRLELASRVLALALKGERDVETLKLYAVSGVVGGESDRYTIADSRSAG